MKQIFLTAALFIIAISAQARTIGEIWATEPGNIFPLLTVTNRLDMMDYFRSGKAVEMVNQLEGTSKLLALDDNYLKLQSSEAKVVEMRLITKGNDTVIAVIETVRIPAPDSHIAFYDRAWHELMPQQYFQMPTLDDFFLPKVDKKKRIELLNEIAFPIIELTLEGESHDLLVARHGLQQHLAKSDYGRFSPYMRPSISYQLNGKKFKKKA